MKVCGACGVKTPENKADYEELHGPTMGTPILSGFQSHKSDCVILIGTPEQRKERGKERERREKEYAENQRMLQQAQREQARMALFDPYGCIHCGMPKPETLLGEWRHLDHHRDVAKIAAAADHAESFHRTYG